MRSSRRFSIVAMKKPRSSIASGGPSLPSSGLARSWAARVEGEGWPRVDAFIARAAAGIVSRSQLKARGAAIRVNGKAAKPSRPLAPGDLVEVEWTEEASPGLEPESLQLSVLYEDERVIVVDKAQGMVTHPGAGNRRGTLANALLGRLVGEYDPGASELDEPASHGLEARNPSFRGGIVHRLDKDTSGLLIAAKDPRSQAFLAAQFKERLARKEYLAITRGIPSPPAGRIADRLGRDKRDRKRFTRVDAGGKVAITDYRVIESWSERLEASGRGTARRMAPESYALISLRPRTGRTHQLRVHMASLGTPILGDPIYSRRDSRFPEATLMLHAFRLTITLPGEDAPRRFRAPPPERFKLLLRSLNAAFGAGKRLK